MSTLEKVVRIIPRPVRQPVVIGVAGLVTTIVLGFILSLFGQ